MSPTASPFRGGLATARVLLRDRFGHPALRIHQLKVLGPLLAGRSVLAVLPTGAGKSLCFQLPALMTAGLTLVVSPLISLMQDQVGALRRRGIAAAYLGLQAGNKLFQYGLLAIGLRPEPSGFTTQISW